MLIMLDNNNRYEGSGLISICIFSSNNFNFLQYFPLHMDCNKFDTFSVSRPCVDVFVVEVCVCVRVFMN